MYDSRPPHGGRGLKSLFLIGIAIFAVGRPPHGGRGLKYIVRRSTVRPESVALPTEGVD